MEIASDIMFLFCINDSGLSFLACGIVKIGGYLQINGISQMIAKLWEPLLSLDWYWYGIVFFVTVIRPWYRIFK